MDSGSRLVQDAGSTMAEIVGGIQRVSDIIGEISAATAEQSKGIGSVNQTVTQLDGMTQQNAALVAESAPKAAALRRPPPRGGGETLGAARRLFLKSAAAADSLREQAGQLAVVIQAFRLSGQAA